MRPKYTLEQAELICEEYRLGYLQRELAERHGLHQTTISRIIRGAMKDTTRKSFYLRAEGKKRCYACDEIKSLDDFNNNKSNWDGKSTACKKCDSSKFMKLYRENPEPFRMNMERWRLENPERSREIGRKARSTRRARLEGAFVEVVDPEVVFERDGGICKICGLPIEDKFEIDHIIPLAQGGKHSYDNVRLSHVSCNRQRPRSIKALHDPE